MALEGRRKASLNPFSPWRSPADSLQRTLVGRDHIIKDILEKTQRFCKGAPAKHCLIIGRRGLGKTHVIALLFHYYEKNCIIPKFESISNDVLTIFLLEEERYSLNSLALFLVKIFEKFVEKSPGETKWDIPQYLDSDEDVIEYCFEKLKNISNSEKKKIIILCDNLEDVFKQWQEKEYKTLRAFLSDQQSIMIIGTAVKIFKEIISPKQPFYEFFETVPLPDLSDTQMVELLKKRFIEDNLGKEFNRKEKYLKNKVAAIAKLTGGNPRLVVFLYDIVTKKNVFEIENATEELMESLNEYFRNRFSDLAPQERTILDAFADMDGPATPKVISKKTRIKEQSTYAHVKKLKDAGYIDTVEFAKHKISRYDVTERLFRLWRQTATISGRKKFQILIRFLKLYFTPEELREDFHRSIKQLDSAFLQNKPEYIDRYIHYLSYLQHAAEGSLKYEIFDTRTDFLLRKGDYEKAEEEILGFKRDIEIGETDYDQKLIYKKLIKTHLQQQKYIEASKDISQLIKYPISEEKEEYIETLNKIIDKYPDNDQAWFSKGKILVNTDSDLKEALKFFNKAVKLNPKEPEYYYRKGVTLRRLNRIEEALPLIEKAIELDGNNATYWNEKGVILGNFEKHEEVLKTFKKASELEPEEADYYGHQAAALNNLNRPEEALQLADKAIDSRPHVPEYYYYKAYALRNLNRFEEALLLIEKAIELDEKNSIFLKEKGLILGESGKHEEALKAFKKSSELEPKEAGYYHYQTLALRNLSRVEEALLLIEKAIELDGKNSIYWQEKGVILWESGKHEEALQAFDKACELEPKKASYYHNQAQALRNLNRMEEALPFIEKAIELDEKNSIYWQEKGVILGNSQKHELALQAFKKASELAPIKPNYYYFQAFALRKLNRFEEALPLIEKSIELDRNNSRFWYEKGVILGNSKKYEEALKYLKKANELEPNEPVYYFDQAIVLSNLNRLEEALQLIDKAIELDGKNSAYWEKKGLILSNSEKHEDAFQTFKKVSELKPKQAEYYHLQALALRNLNRLEEAVPLIEKAIELDEKNSVSWNEKGLILGESGKHEEALQAFDKACELEPKEAGYYHNQALALSNLNRLKEALPLIVKAIELDGKNSIYWNEMGVILGNSGKHEEALQAFKKASELKPEQDEYYHLQSFALHSLNRFEEALLLIEKAIELNREKLTYWKEKSRILTKAGKYEEGLRCFQESIELNPEDIDHKLNYLGFLIYSIKNMEKAGNYLIEIEKTFYDQIKDNLNYLHWKSEYLILTRQFEEAIPLVEKRFEKQPDDWDARVCYLINKACLGEFGDNMEGLAGKIIKVNLYELQIVNSTEFIFGIIEKCLVKGDIQRANGLYMTLLKLNEWHKINEVQEIIALYLRKLVDIKNRELFINSVSLANKHISDKNLLELIKAFLYAGKYLKEGNKVILEEVFPEIREIIFDIIEKFE